MQQFFDFNLGHLLTILTIWIAYVGVKQNQKRDAEEVKRRLEERHEENQEKLTNIRVQIQSLMHLDDCLDEVKNEVSELRKHIYACFKGTGGGQ